MAKNGGIHGDGSSDEAAELEQQMDTDVAELKEKGSGPIRSHLNPVFKHEMRASTAVDSGEETVIAARGTGIEAADGDEERRKIEREVEAMEQRAPRSTATKDAEAAEAQAEKDADDAIAASMNADEFAFDARKAEGSPHLHLHADPAAAMADATKAEAEEARAAHDLVDIDSLEKRVEADDS